MFYKFLVFCVQVALNIAVAYSVLHSPQNINTTNNYLLIGYVWLVVFTLPSLISKMFGAKYFGLGSMVSFLYYPLLFLASFFVASVVGASISMGIIIPLSITIVFWNILLLVVNFGGNSINAQNLLKASGFITLSLLFVLTIYFIVGRPLNSVVANDYLVHKSATTNLMSVDYVCTIPSQCSNLFLEDAYTTFYHTVAGLVWEAGFDFSVASYVLDIVFSAFMLLVIVSLFKKAGLKAGWAVVAAFGAFLVYDPIAFSLIMFLPQTFTLMLFLQWLQSKKISWWKLIIGILVLLLAHWFIGIYLSIMAAVYYVVLVKLLPTHKRIHRFRFWGLLLLLLVTFVLVLSNAAGYTVELLLQQSFTESFGYITNLVFPLNLQFLLGLFGLATLPLIVGALYYVVQVERKSRLLVFGILFLFLALFAYLLGPVHANKFMLAVGIFGSFVLFGVISKSGMNSALKLSVGLLVFSALLLNYRVTYQDLLTFYTQYNGHISAIVEKDLDLVDEVKQSEWANGCYFISDPHTQLTIATLANKQTAGGNYQQLDLREEIDDLLDKPSFKDLQDIKKQAPEGLSTCFIYSARLKQIYEDPDLRESWLGNIYLYPLDTYREIDTNVDPVAVFLSNVGNEPVYKDLYFAVYVLN